MKKVSILILFLILLTFAFYKALDFGLIWFVYPSKDKYPIKGIDVSNHQGKINWSLVPKNEISFVYIKATEGGDFKDKAFVYNWTAAKKEGFKVGAYHFFTLCKTGIEQAENFIKTVPKEPDSLPPVVDLEFEGNCKERPNIENVQLEIQNFLDKIDSHYEHETILYLTKEFINKYLGDNLFNHPIWIRNIFMHPNTFSSIEWTIWQYKSTERIIGIDGPVDVNVLKGNIHSIFTPSPPMN
ncbi:lysozyme [Leptospira congkakensis]|uniref:Lysozyme n=1 Tax=Leptospira congkakensis TaxID=2484932 RepID=A0A4Z1A275_9LEPT|nr:GH25 family lysozyme [Leptospira congkakensis]TGL87780.1 lysozyme [Leptospira congkakensis]TGL89604.1 lysozyme [Leptospira congkakensis]TGL95930.1 lysozyme [Leptospira congkakensis]